MDFILEDNIDEMSMIAWSTGWKESCLSKSLGSAQKKGLWIKEISQGLGRDVLRVVHECADSEPGGKMDYVSIR